MHNKRDFLTIPDLDALEVIDLLDKAADYKAGRVRGGAGPLADKTVALIFKKPSTRTRVSFDVAINKLGGHSLALSGAELQLGRGETIEDTSRVLSRYVDAIVIRTDEHDEVARLAASASVPVVNALTDDFHPCQALADLLTIRERQADFSKVRLAYIGDGNNVCHSLILAAAMVDMEIAIGCPKGYEPSRAVLTTAVELAKRPESITVTDDPAQAAAGADFLYTDVWTSMGQDDESRERHERFAGFQIDTALLGRAKDDALVMHCLPAYRGEEISAEVMDGPRSIVFDQAENRLHAQTALLAFLVEASS